MPIKCQLCGRRISKKKKEHIQAMKEAIQGLKEGLEIYSHKVSKEKTK